jgi:hypothetical protein
LTATTMSAPTMAMAELWLRFFAVFLSPLCLAWMVQWDISRNSVKRAAVRGNTGVATIVVSIVGLASSAVLFTDSLYVYEYGRWFGFSLFVLSSIMAVRCAASVAEDKDQHAGRGKGKTSGAFQKGNAYLLQYAIYVFIAMTTVIFMRSDGGHAMDSLFKRILPTSPVHSTDAETITNNIQNGSYNPIEHMPHPGIDTHNRQRPLPLCLQPFRLLRRVSLGPILLHVQRPEWSHSLLGQWRSTYRNSIFGEWMRGAGVCQSVDTE